MNNSGDIAISVKAWSEVIQNPPVNCKEIYDAINEIVVTLPPNEQYVYFARYPFGAKLIKNGFIPIEKFQFKPDDRFITDFKNDLNYSHDPLGVVLNNHIEVYCPNKSNQNEYNVPINIIKSGELFGLFGTLDSLDKKVLSDNNSLTKPPPEWNAVAGNVCFKILFPFDNDTTHDVLDNNKKYSGFKKKIAKGGSPSLNQVHFSETEKISFIKTCLGNNDWTVDVIYFPAKIISRSTIKLQNLLFKIGWKQSSHLRNALFENKLISDKIKDLSLKNDEFFLATFYNYLLKIVNEEAYVLKPIKNNHVLTMAINKFKEENIIREYIQANKSFYPIILGYEKLNADKWGILSTDWLPILLKHSVKDIKSLYEDLNKIMKECNMDQFQLKYVTYNKTLIEKEYLQQKIRQYVAEDIQKYMGKNLKQYIKMDGRIEKDTFFQKIYLTGYSLHNFLLIEKCF